MEKVTGIKSVDFKIRALGYGVVNWNGSPNLTIIDDGKYKNVTNHSMPKLRGYTNIKEFLISKMLQLAEAKYPSGVQS